MSAATSAGERAEPVAPDACPRTERRRPRVDPLVAGGRRRFDDGSTWHGTLVPQRAACRNAERRSEKSPDRARSRHGRDHPHERPRAARLRAVAPGGGQTSRSSSPTAHISVLEGSIGAFPRRLLVPATTSRRPAGSSPRRGSPPSCGMPEADAAIAEDAFLGGRVRLRQPRRGHRAGTDAVLLAALVAPRRSETVYDLGAGTSAPSGSMIGGRTAPRGRVRRARARAPAALCRREHRAERLDRRAPASIEADLLAPAAERRGRRTRRRESADWVVTNPPFLEEGRARRSPDVAARRGAPPARRRPRALDRRRRRSPAAEGAPGAHSPGGRARRVPRSSRARFRGVAIRPVHPAPGRAGDPDSRSPRRRPAARRHGFCRASCCMSAAGAFTPEAEALHRGESLLVA